MAKAQLESLSAPHATPPKQRRARMHPLPPVFPHAWAVAYGEDRYGLWQAFEVGDVRQVLRWIPPGEFQMGSPEDEAHRLSHETLHVVRLTQGHWLADTACTQALWAAVMDGDAPSRFKDDPQNPVEQVSWDDVVDKFLPRLNTLLPGLGLRLSSEAEWECACRGEAEPAAPFWFGGQIDSTLVNFEGGSPMPHGKKSAFRHHTVPVKALPCNGWGLYQMHGNVLEWCGDWLAPYAAGEATDPTGPSEAPAEQARRVIRGGSWYDLALGCRSADRFSEVPDERSVRIGFRLARGAS